MSEEMQLELEHTLKTMRELKEAKAEIERLRAALDEQVQWVKDLADSLMEAEGKIGVKNARIEQLEEANELMLTDIRRTDVDMMAFKTEIEHYRKTLRDIMRQCNNPIYGSAPGMERMIDRIEDMAIDALGIATKPMKQDASDE